MTAPASRRTPTKTVTAPLDPQLCGSICISQRWKEKIGHRRCLERHRIFGREQSALIKFARTVPGLSWRQYTGTYSRAVATAKAVPTAVGVDVEEVLDRV